MGCGCNGHYGYSTNGVWHPYQYPYKTYATLPATTNVSNQALMGCHDHSSAAQRHNGHGAYTYYKNRAVRYHRHTDGCWNHYYWTAALVQDRAITPTDFGDVIEEGTTVSASLHNDLVTAISHERWRWHKSRTVVDGQAVIPGDISTNERIIELRNSMLQSNMNYVDSAPSWTIPAGSALATTEIEDGDMMTSDQMEALRTRVRTLQAVCSCNCNYCTCNCNYCTCNCNYSCTCNCNY